MANPPSTGFVDPTGANGPTAVPYNDVDLSIGVTNDVGQLKLGAIENIPNSVAGYAVRSKQLSFNLTAATQTAVAHGLVDENGNAIAPVEVTVLYANTYEVYSSAVPDTTNVYLTAPAATSTAPATGVLVLRY